MTNVYFIIFTFKDSLMQTLFKMKVYILILTTISAILLSCNEKQSTDFFKIENEISCLESFEDKKSYLEAIYKDDQRVRDAEKSTELINKYGINSKEYRIYGQAMRQQDAINLAKIEGYFATYGYPEKEMGEIATMTPWLVIHHAEGYKVREGNFEIIYGAYLEGSIDIDAVSFFLGRMYEIKFGERFRMGNPYRLEDEVDMLMEKLGLENN